MIFSTWLYGFFLAVVTTVYWLAPRHWRAGVLLVAGALFYAAYHPAHLGLILAVTLAVHVAARAGGTLPDPARRRLVLGAAAAAALGLLAYYKYTGFARETLAALDLPAGWLPLPPHAVPLAISFFVFEYVHYLLDVRRGRLAPGRTRDVFLFVLFFPTLVCGPIKRFESFQPQIDAIDRPDPAALSRGLERILIGLGKKLLVADTLQRAMAVYWDAPLEQPHWRLWLMMYSYAAQIYFDFAGYSDIAIGSARLLGYTVPENFDRPYRRATIAGFWSAWHMSLTAWIRDYVYIPLGGNRCAPWRAQANRLVAMALCGLWHGAQGHFVLWGTYHGLGLATYHAWRGVRTRLLGERTFGMPGRIVATLVTFHFVCFGWILFVLDTRAAVGVVARLVGLA